MFHRQQYFCWKYLASLYACIWNKINSDFWQKYFDRFIESSFSCDFPINQECKIFYQNCCDFVFTSGLTCLLCDLLALALPVLKSMTKSKKSSDLVLRKRPLKRASKYNILKSAALSDFVIDFGLLDSQGIVYLCSPPLYRQGNNCIKLSYLRQIKHSNL